MSMQELMKYKNIAKGQFLRTNNFRKIENIEYEKKEGNNIVFKVSTVGDSKYVEIRVPLC